MAGPELFRPAVVHREDRADGSVVLRSGYQPGPCPASIVEVFAAGPASTQSAFWPRSAMAMAGVACRGGRRPPGLTRSPLGWWGVVSQEE